MKFIEREIWKQNIDRIKLSLGKRILKEGDKLLIIINSL